MPEPQSSIRFDPEVLAELARLEAEALRAQQELAQFAAYQSAASREGIPTVRPQTPVVLPEPGAISGSRAPGASVAAQIEAQSQLAARGRAIEESAERLIEAYQALQQSRLAAARLEAARVNPTLYAEITRRERQLLQRVINAGNGFDLPGDGPPIQRLLALQAEVEVQIFNIEKEIFQATRMLEPTSMRRLPPGTIRPGVTPIAEHVRLYAEAFRVSRAEAELALTQMRIDPPPEEIAAMLDRAEGRHAIRTRLNAYRNAPSVYANILVRENDLSQRLAAAGDGSSLPGRGTPSEKLARFRAYIQGEFRGLAIEIENLANMRPGAMPGVPQLPPGTINANTTFREHVQFRVDIIGEPVEVAERNVLLSERVMSPGEVERNLLQRRLAAMITPRAASLLTVLRYLGYVAAVVGTIAEAQAFAESLADGRAIDDALSRLIERIARMETTALSAGSCQKLKAELLAMDDVISRLKTRHAVLISQHDPRTRSLFLLRKFNPIDTRVRTLRERLSTNCVALEGVARIQAVTNLCVLPSKGALTIAIGAIREARRILWSETTAIGRYLEGLTNAFITRDLAELTEYRENLDLGTLTPAELKPLIDARIASFNLRSSREVGDRFWTLNSVRGQRFTLERALQESVISQFLDRYNAILVRLRETLNRCPPPVVSGRIPLNVLPPGS